MLPESAEYAIRFGLAPTGLASAVPVVEAGRSAVALAPVVLVFAPVAALARVVASVCFKLKRGGFDG